jgi:rSAM/selenodomain-associated transferase 2
MADCHISIVIPVLNEAPALGMLLPALLAQAAPEQIIVVDGGSVDGSAKLAERLGVQVLCTERGRGQQLARGAATATGESILFLHADSVFPRGGLAAIQRALADRPDAIGGNFRLLFDGDGPFDRWLEGFYAWIRSKGFYYGDSGIFLRRHCYQRLGGIRPIAVMEDYDLVRRMEAARPTLCITEPPLLTSSRRFRGRHPLAIVAGWFAIHLLFHIGLSPARIARLYDSARRRQASGLQETRT